MAGASLNSIKTRLKSVESTRQITKAMELVSTSKLRRAKERAEGSRAYHEELSAALSKILGMTHEDSEENEYFTEREVKKTCYIVIAGDRGLAGGYNNNIFKLADKTRTDADCVLPIGKKAREYFARKKADTIDVGYETVTEVGSGGATDIASLLCSEFKARRFDKIVVIYTKFVSMMTQTAATEQLLPLERTQTPSEHAESFDAMCDVKGDELVESLVPFCVSGLIYSALCEAEASEHGMRRNAMNSANKNADEIIGDLHLKYNRARQAAITQEITEIVSGAEAL